MVFVFLIYHTKTILKEVHHPKDSNPAIKQIKLPDYILHYDLYDYYTIMPLVVMLVICFGICRAMECEINL